MAHLCTNSSLYTQPSGQPWGEVREPARDLREEGSGSERRGWQLPTWGFFPGSGLLALRLPRRLALPPPLFLELLSHYERGETRGNHSWGSRSSSGAFPQKPGAATPQGRPGAAQPRVALTICPSQRGEEEPGKAWEGVFSEPQNMARPAGLRG